MPTRISTGAGVSLLFITAIPIDCKITNFLLFVFFVCFLRDHLSYVLVRAQLIVSGKSVSQYTSYSLIFSPFTAL